MFYPVNTECTAHSNSIPSSIFKMKSTFHFKSPRDNWSAFLLCNGFAGRGGWIFKSPLGDEHFYNFICFRLAGVTQIDSIFLWKSPKIKIEGHLGSWQAVEFHHIRLAKKRRQGPEWTPALRTLSLVSPQCNQIEESLQGNAFPFTYTA